MAPLDPRNDDDAGGSASATEIGGGGIAVIAAFVGLVAYLVGYDAPRPGVERIATPLAVAHSAPRATPEDGIADPQAFGPIKITPVEPDDDIATATIAKTEPVAVEDEPLEPQAFGPIKITPAEPDEDIATASIAKTAPAAVEEEPLEPQAFGPIKVTPAGPEDDVPTASIAKPAAARAKASAHAHTHHAAKPHAGLNTRARTRHGSPCPSSACDLPSAKSAHFGVLTRL